MSLIGFGRIYLDDRNWLTVAFVDRDAAGREQEVVVGRFSDKDKAEAVHKRYAAEISLSGNPVPKDVIRKSSFTAGQWKERRDDSRANALSKDRERQAANALSKDRERQAAKRESASSLVPSIERAESEVEVAKESP